jgi:hypothetical protein
LSVGFFQLVLFAHSFAALEDAIDGMNEHRLHLGFGPEN